MKNELLGTLGAFSRPLLQPARSVAVDSRLVLPGALFFALAGEKCDGHDFLHEAKQKGAVGAVIRDDFAGEVPLELPVVRVSHPLHALQMFARDSVAANGSKVCAITGSLGKTTTKEFLKTIVSQEKTVAATTKSHNSQIGLSLSLLNEMQGNEEWLVAEMGMSHAGDISALTSIAPPEVAVVTNVNLVHAENFTSLEAIAQAKAEIFARSETKCCLFNADTNHAHVLAHAASERGKSFSMQDKAAFWCMHLLDESLSIREDTTEKIFSRPSFPAPHVYENLLAAIAASRVMGVSWQAIEAALPLLTLPPQRLEHLVCRGIHFINDACNACETSMLAALEVLREASGSRKVAVLGAMKELGAYSLGCHKRVGERAFQIADTLYFLGQEWLSVVEVCKCKEKKCIVASTTEELIAELEKELAEGDTVLLKGSRWANQLWKVVEHFQGV